MSYRQAPPLLTAAIVVLLAGCGTRSGETTAGRASDADVAVATGADVLARDNFAMLRGLRVGLITNQTARVGDEHLADLLAAAPDVQLVALFGPEHGIRGTADAGSVVGDSVDVTTGVPVFSLYGEHRSPTDEMLEGVDALVFDIQDIGARFYTYISTMGLSMQAAARRGIPFFVLDRPNPLSGEYVSGFVLEPEYRSFVGEYQIPVAHGLTIGELALMIQGEPMLQGADSVDLRVVEMEGWTRSMQWPDTGLEWLPPSPNIPSFETALVYPGACFVEATTASEGRGTREPFIKIGAPRGQRLAQILNARGLPGVHFERIQFTPRSIPGMSTRPKLEGERLEGVEYMITDRRAFRPVEAGVHLLHALLTADATAADSETGIIRDSGMRRLAGTERLADMLGRRVDPETIIASWQEEVDAFRERRQPYLLYP